MEHIGLWAEFIVAAFLVILAGSSLSKNAEKLAEAMGWGHALTGFVVLGWATSLPELTISISAVSEVGSPGLSAGTLVGSVIFNLAILAVLFLLSGPHHVQRHPPQGGVLPLGLANLVLLAGTWILLVGSGGHFPFAVATLLLAGYLATTVHSWRGRRDHGPPGRAPRTRARARAPALSCLAAGAVILGAGIWVAHLGEQLALTYSLREGFVGTLFLASVSSLPELVTGLVTLRAGLLTMAAASILGSNIFNLAILGVCDLIHLLGPGADPRLPLILAAGEPALANNLLAAFGLTLLAVAVLVLRGRAQRPRTIQAMSVAMLLIYLGALSRA